MTKRKKLVKNALKHPEQFTSADLQYMELWLAEKARQKEVKKKAAISLQDSWLLRRGYDLVEGV